MCSWVSACRDVVSGEIGRTSSHEWSGSFLVPPAHLGLSNAGDEHRLLGHCPKFKRATGENVSNEISYDAQGPERMSLVAGNLWGVESLQ